MATFGADPSVQSSGVLYSQQHMPHHHVSPTSATTFILAVAAASFCSCTTKNGSQRQSLHIKDVARMAQPMRVRGYCCAKEPTGCF